MPFRLFVTNRVCKATVSAYKRLKVAGNQAMPGTSPPVTDERGPTERVKRSLYKRSAMPCAAALDRFGLSEEDLKFRSVTFITDKSRGELKCLIDTMKDTFFRGTWAVKDGSVEDLISCGKELKSFYKGIKDLPYMLRCRLHRFLYVLRRKLRYAHTVSVLLSDSDIDPFPESGEG